MFRLKGSAALVVLAGLAALTIASAGGCRVATLGMGETTVTSGDGLGLKLDVAGKIVAVSLDDHELPAQLSRMILAGGFFVRNAGESANQELTGSVGQTADGAVFTASPSGLAVRANVVAKADRIEVVGIVTNTAGGERAVTIGLSLPVNAAGWRFGRSVLQSEVIVQSPVAEWTCADSDWDGRQINHGMFTPIYNERAGLAMGACCDHPEVFRVSYRQDRGFVIEADFGLSPIPQRFPNCATFKFVIYRFEPMAGGYRSALAKYFRMFPDDYVVRVNKFGNWFSSANLKTIKAKAADYAVVFDSHGARYFKEAAEQGVYAFEYSRGEYDVIPIYGADPNRAVPPPDKIRDAVTFFWAAQTRFKEQTWRRDSAPATQADSGRNCHTWGPDGQMRTWTVEGPYTYARWPYFGSYMAADIPMNPDPKLPSPNQAERVLNWNFGEPLLDARAGGFKLAGHHFDGWDDFSGKFLENHRPSHWRSVSFPLAWSYWNHRPAQFAAFMWQELIRPFGEFLHSQDMLLFANVRPWRASVMFEQGLMDVYGGSERTERNLEYMAFMRSLISNRPISGTGIGQKEDDPDAKYSARELAQFERDLNILLPYCWFPGGFGPKDLWQKYCRPMQEMMAAGWQPVSGAVVAHPDLLVERYGGPDSAKVFYVVHNRSEGPIAYEMAIDLATIKADPKTVGVVDRLTGTAPEATTVEQALVLRGRLAGRGTDLIELSRTGGNVKPNVNLTLATTPCKSTIAPPAKFDPAKRASSQFAATMAYLDLRPKSAEVLWAAYELEKRELAAAIAFHLGREKPADPNGAAVELANWLAPRYDGIYEAILNGPLMPMWTGLRANYKDPKVWRMGASAKPAGEGYQVEVWDPLLERPPGDK